MNLAFLPFLFVPLATLQGTREPALPDTSSEQDLRVAPSHSPDPDVGTTIVTATRATRTTFESPFATDVIDAQEIERKGFRTVPQALRETPGVMVQETAFGQGSPYIRGFTGFRNLFLIDGIRLNNSVFRDGPNQYWNTVDPYSIERIEVVKGPTSVLYGSDAIGGTVNAITKLPYSYTSGFGAGGLLGYRGATAEHSNIGRAELSTTFGTETGVLTGLTGKRFGDVRGGEDVGTQEGTGYDEYDVDVKVEHFLSPTRRLIAAYQRVDQRDVPRTHRTTDAIDWKGLSPGTDLRRDLDQERRLAYVQLHEEDADGAGFTVSASYHAQAEERDRVRGSGARELQGFDVQTLGAFAHARTVSPIGRLTYGLELYHDDVDSFSSTNTIQGPVADDATYDLAGIFVQDEVQASERLSFVLGARWNWAMAESDKVRDPVSGLATSLDDSWSALVGSARLLFGVTEEVNLFGGVSQGFRAPNLSDLTRFDSARSNEFEIPSTDLDPEYFLSYELGVKLQRDGIGGELALFYTDITDAIVRFPTGNVNPDGDFEITKDNVGDGYVYGIELGGAARVRPHWQAFGGATWMEGKVDTFPTSAPVIEREYIDRLMPLTLHAGLGWENEPGTRWAEFSSHYAAEADRLSTRDEGDTSRIPPGGTPSYLVFHVRGGMDLSERVRVTGAVENLLDEDYRIHGSGLNMPGRNFVLGLTASF
jgi:hemoglobin/transferrin/lactoferrin receptor protein